MFAEKVKPMRIEIDPLPDLSRGCETPLAAEENKKEPGLAAQALLQTSF